jgi:cyclopropane fatty-acyl-phospholipid synthase-like methyltransferase
MSDFKRIYDELRKSEMNDWVGGSDPESVGDACVRILDRYLTINASSRLLDFGCGVGRVLLSVLKHKPNVGRITGFDIMPQVISFCDTHIANEFPQARFELIDGSNDHYDQFIAAAGINAAKSKTLLQSEYASQFTGAYAFSVFTHVETVDFRALLSLLSNLLEPGGELLLTAFLLTPYSRSAIEQRTTSYPFGESAYEAQGNIFIGNSTDRLGFIAFDLALVEQMVFDAGLVITHVEHGSWTGAAFSGSLQDVIVCRRPRELAGAVQHVSIVPRPPRH